MAPLLPVRVAVPVKLTAVTPVPETTEENRQLYAAVAVQVVTEVVVPVLATVSGAFDVPDATVPNGAELDEPPYVA